MDTPSKEQIRKAKKSESNRRFREKVKTEKESSQDTESIKSDTKSSDSNFFFFETSGTSETESNTGDNIHDNPVGGENDNFKSYVKYITTFKQWCDTTRERARYIATSWVFTCQLLNMLQIYLGLLIISQIKYIVLH